MNKDGANNNKHCAANAMHSKFAASWDDDVPAPALSSLVTTIIVIAISAICFYNSLNGDFVFDDSEAIVNNNDIRSTTPISSLFQNDFWGTRLTHPSSHKSYRPLTVISFRINYLLGDLEPYGYHLLNLMLHCIVSALSLQVFYIIFGKTAPRASFLSSILFASHPVHTEAVSGIVGRADLLCALFVFVAFLSYVKFAEEVDSVEVVRKENSQLKYSWTNGIYLFLVLLSTGIAMLCKEVGITALGLCSVYDILLAHEGRIGNILQSCIFDRNASVSYRKLIQDGVFRNVIIRHIFLLLYGTILLITRWIVMGSTVPKFMAVDNPASFLDSFLFRILNYHYVYSLNCFLLIAPIWLCFDWSMGCIPVISSLLDLRLIAVILLWFGIGLISYKGVTTRGRTRRCVLISLALGIIPFLPASNLFFRVGFVIAERVLYIPVAGLCILVVTGIRELCASKYVSKNGLQLCYILLVSVFILRCHQRSNDWLTEKKLFKSGLDVCPLNAKVHYNLGKVAADSGNINEAVHRYREALKLNTDYDQAMNNLANILKDLGYLDEALQLLLRATKIRPDFAAAWMNLGIIQASTGKHREAETSYLTALSNRSIYPDCLYNLGNLYLEMGYHAKALSAWTNATSLKPSLAVAWTNMLILLDSEGKYDVAIEMAFLALEHLPNEPALHFNLANTLGKLNQYKDSEKHFIMATKLDPGNANYWANLGVLYHRWKKYELAERTYRHALKISPTVKSAQENLSMLLRSIGKNGT